KVNEPALPPIRLDGINVLPWSVLAETRLDRQYRPTFAKYLKELDGKQVVLTGYLQPLDQEQALDLSAFMLIEYPVGCWFCEMPEITAIAFVEMPPGKTKSYTRGQVKVQGTLKLNANDPENFLYLISKAKVRDAD